MKMKQILYMFLAASLLLVGCEDKTTENISVESPEPLFELIGDDIVLVAKKLPNQIIDSDIEIFDIAEVAKTKVSQ